MKLSRAKHTAVSLIAAFTVLTKSSKTCSSRVRLNQPDHLPVALLLEMTRRQLLSRSMCFSFSFLLCRGVGIWNGSSSWLCDTTINEWMCDVLSLVSLSGEIALPRRRTCSVDCLNFVQSRSSTLLTSQPWEQGRIQDFDRGGGPAEFWHRGALSPKFAQNRGFPLQIACNLGGPLDPLVEKHHLNPRSHFIPIPSAWPLKCKTEQFLVLFIRSREGERKQKNSIRPHSTNKSLMHPLLPLWTISPSDVKGLRRLPARKWLHRHRAPHRRWLIAVHRVGKERVAQSEHWVPFSDQGVVQSKDWVPPEGKSQRNQLAIYHFVRFQRTCLIAFSWGPSWGPGIGNPRAGLSCNTVVRWLSWVKQPFQRYHSRNGETFSGENAPLSLNLLCSAERWKGPVGSIDPTLHVRRPVFCVTREFTHLILWKDPKSK